MRYVILHKNMLQRKQYNKRKVGILRDWIYTDKLFCNNYKAVVLCEYTGELFLLSEFIEIAEKAVSRKENTSWHSYEGICYIFAKSIAEYAKMAYGKIILGHFFATHMVIRAMIENNVCLDIIYNDEKEELWKYYFVQSYRNSVMQAKEGLSQKDGEFICRMYSDYDIQRAFYESRGDKKAYIDLPYGWTFTINKRFSFKGICELVNVGDYDDFTMMSDYSHGTSIYQKMGGSVCIEHFMSMISSIYVGLYRLVTMYCWDCADDTFDEIAEKIENSICGALGI